MNFDEMGVLEIVWTFYKRRFWLSGGLVTEDGILFSSIQFLLEWEHNRVRRNFFVLQR